MKNEQYVYTTNPMIKNTEINLYFEDLNKMSPEIFRKWVQTMRVTTKRYWDETGCPCISGRTHSAMRKDFERLTAKATHLLAGTSDENVQNEKKTGLVSSPDLIVNTFHCGSSANQFFPSMMKVPINYSLTKKGYSIYDLFDTDNKEKQAMVEKRCIRHFKKDGFYKFSHAIKRNDKETGIIEAETAKDWIEAFRTHRHSIFRQYDYWLSPTKGNTGVSSGYVAVDTSNILGLSSKEVVELNIDKDRTNVLEYPLDNSLRYDIRLYKMKDKRVFPSGYESFRVGYCQVAVNFPPLTAKYLYERYTEHLVREGGILNIYDFAAGWGGRILGAMSVKDNRRIHYIGTDVNGDNWVNPELSRYKILADWYNENTSRCNQWFTHKNTYDIFRCGSENIAQDSGFQRYLGKLDFAFSSPAYFIKEAYSADPEQSCVKFGNSYESWRDGFLEPTLRTVCENLRSDRYAGVNIADVTFSGNILPLEADTQKIMEKYGMTYVRTEKMLLQGMPGANRVDKDGNTTTKNSVVYQGKHRKYEPIFIFYKK